VCAALAATPPDAALPGCAVLGTAVATVVPPRRTAVPSYPLSSLDDENGLRVPASGMGAGGWTAFWSRAHTHH
jgi:hypothetical protein